MNPKDHLPGQPFPATPGPAPTGFLRHNQVSTLPGLAPTRSLGLWCLLGPEPLWQPPRPPCLSVPSPPNPHHPVQLTTPSTRTMDPLPAHSPTCQASTHSQGLPGPGHSFTVSQQSPLNLPHSPSEITNTFLPSYLFIPPTQFYP